MSVAALIEGCRALHDDLGLSAARAWKEAAPGRRVIGYLPTWVPRELIHAAGMLPFGIIGGGDRVEIIKGDAYFQSYICHLPRSVVELGVSGRLDVLDGVLFPSICDVIRNLSGMWQLLFPALYVKYLDVPQDFDPAIGGAYFRKELEELRGDLAALGGRPVTDDALRASIAAYDENRRLVNAVLERRAAEPWRVPASETWLLLRAGLAMPVEEHSGLLRRYLDEVAAENRPERDDSRVVLRGAFCEQPPLDLVKTLERAGCAIVDDDFFLVLRWFDGDIGGGGGDPLAEIVSAYLSRSVTTAARYERSAGHRGRVLVRTVGSRDADGVVFAAPSFCDPALLERPMLQRAAEDAGIPFTAFKYAENTGQFQPIREQAGTFADSIKLWGNA